ncbi:MAG: transposase [Pseudomonadales bacterium]|nr:transposase [Pseudomonadales bacterium]
MSRPVRIEFPGAHYHITTRGLDDRTVFADNEDRIVFLNVMDTVVSRFGWLIHSYVLMDNHYHLIVEIPQGNLSKGMRQLNGVYTQHFNRRHGIDGSLFQGRFKSVLFEPEVYLLPLCRHVMLNPTRIGKSRSVQTHRWSSYRAFAGMVNPPVWLCTEKVMGHFGGISTAARNRFKTYVKEGVGLESPLAMRSSQVLLGSPAFISEMQPVLNGEKLLRKGPRAAGRRRTLNGLFGNVGHKTRAERNDLIRKAHIDHNYTLMEIGEFLDLHYTTVSKIVNQ